ATEFFYRGRSPGPAPQVLVPRVLSCTALLPCESSLPCTRSFLHSLFLALRGPPDDLTSRHRLRAVAGASRLIRRFPVITPLRPPSRHLHPADSNALQLPALSLPAEHRPARARGDRRRVERRGAHPAGGRLGAGHPGALDALGALGPAADAGGHLRSPGGRERAPHPTSPLLSGAP